MRGCSTKLAARRLAILLGLAAVFALPAAGGAASPANRIADLRARDTSLASREQAATQQLYSIETQLGAHGAAGLAGKKAGRKPKLTEAERLNAQLVKRNAELERKLHVANVLIALQKKAHELLGIALPESDGDS